MTLGRKTLLLQLLVSAGSILLSIVVLRTVVFPPFVEIEQQLVELNQKRVTNAVEELERVMLTMAGDYGAWTPTYEFMANPNDGYIRDNVSAATLRNIDAHAVLLIDGNGKIFADYLLTDESDEKLLFHEIVIDPDAVLATMDATEDTAVRKTGIVQTHLGPMAVASHPIIKTSLKGEPRGTLIFGTLINDKHLAKVSERLSVHVEAIPTDSLAWQMEDGAAVVVDNHQLEDYIYSYQLLDDVFGQPALLLQFRMPHAISAAGMQASLVAMTILALSAVVILLVSFFALKRMVIGPLGTLTNHITTLRKGSDLADQLDVSRRDEIGVLATEFNAMMQRVARSQAKMAAAKDRMKEARDEAQFANEAKSQFLANMSHEIRTPMNGVLGMTELLLNSDDLGPNERRFGEIVKSSAQGLLAIINDILDISKIEAGKMELHLAPFDLRHCIEGTLELLAATADQKGLQLVREIDPQLPAMVSADETRLRQVLINLIGNAIKFTEVGRVRVSARLDESSDEESRVHFSVSDTGIGIAKSDHANIYGNFSQADDSHSRQFGGTGLGLAISRRIVELMGSQIDLESEPGVGSTFSFTVNLRHAAGDAEFVSNVPQRIEQQEPPGPTRNARVLVVEDNVVNQQVTAGMLYKLGCVVDVASDGIEGVEAFNQGDYDIVLMDCQMPRLDGFEATRRIRQHEASEGLQPAKIVAITANALSGDREKCIEAGMNCYLSKPFTLEDLDDLLARQLPADGSTPQVVNS
jgi:signal transduction histidine kinase/ActR/RegA family two-component response regulator